jgi:hypothetical protein
MILVLIFFLLFLTLLSLSFSSFCYFTGAVISLTGGSLNMEATCTITGAGDLVVNEGEHNLAFSINAHITISGGSLIWPLSRGPKQTITFYGGLLINGTSTFVVVSLALTHVFVSFFLPCPQVLVHCKSNRLLQLW